VVFLRAANGEKRCSGNPSRGLFHELKIGHGLTFSKDYVRLNIMGVAHLQGALERLTAAIRDVESELAAMKAEHDPLASHIFISRRHYRNANDTKGGKRRETNARLSFNKACELGFHGSLDEWERLMGAVAAR
jgi:hypothetical protein